jgi:hypothetical protein
MQQVSSGSKCAGLLKLLAEVDLIILQPSGGCRSFSLPRILVRGNQIYKKFDLIECYRIKRNMA